MTFSLRFSTSLLCTLALLSISAYGDEAPAEIDKARVFPVQKNPIVEHSQKADKPSDADPKKPNPKDTYFFRVVGGFKTEIINGYF